MVNVIAISSILNVMGNSTNVKEEIQSTVMTITDIEQSSSPTPSMVFGDIRFHPGDIIGSSGMYTDCEHSLPSTWSTPSLETSYHVSESGANKTYYVSESDASTTYYVSESDAGTTYYVSKSDASTTYYVSESDASTTLSTAIPIHPTTTLPTNTNYPSTTNYLTGISSTNVPTSTPTTIYPSSIITTNYPTFSEIVTATSTPNVTDRSPIHNLSGDVGLIFGGIIGALSFLTIVIIVIILIHKRIRNRRESSYIPKSRGVKVLPDKVTGGNYKASKILGRQYEDIDLTEGMPENDQTLTETLTENCYYKSLESVEGADSIYHHLGADSSSEPVRDDNYHHIDVNFQPCQSSTNEYKIETNSHRGTESNYDHIHLPTSKSGVQNPNYNHIQVSSIKSEQCDSNYDHIALSQQVAPNLRRNDNYHHIEL